MARRSVGLLSSRSDATPIVLTLDSWPRHAKSALVVPCARVTKRTNHGSALPNALSMCGMLLDASAWTSIGAMREDTSDAKSLALPPVGHQWRGKSSPDDDLDAWVCARCGSLCFEERQGAVRFEVAAAAADAYPLNPYRKEAGEGEDWHGYGDGGGPVLDNPPSCVAIVAKSRDD